MAWKESNEFWSTQEHKVVAHLKTLPRKFPGRTEEKLRKTLETVCVLEKIQTGKSKIQTRRVISSASLLF
jgi:hypothetical protein